MCIFTYAFDLSASLSVVTHGPPPLAPIEYILPSKIAQTISTCTTLPFELRQNNRSPYRRFSFFVFGNISASCAAV